MQFGTDRHFIGSFPFTFLIQVILSLGEKKQQFPETKLHKIPFLACLLQKWRPEVDEYLEIKLPDHTEF